MTVKGADGNPVTLQKVTVSEKPELKIYEPHKKLFTVDFAGDVQQPHGERKPILSPTGMVE